MKKTLLFINLLISLLLFIISYAYVDQTLISIISPSLPRILNLIPLVKLVAHYRHPFAFLWLLCLSLIFISQIIFLLNQKALKYTKITLITIFLTCLFLALSFPYLSKDIFTYIYSGRMILVFHQNPYQVTPNQLASQDIWVNLCHWVDRPYAYGPTMLFLNTLLMVILNPNRIIDNFYAVKILNLILFIYTGYLFSRKNKKQTLALWFYNPLLLIELLQNSHNDLIMISLFVFSFTFKFKNKILKYIIFVSSVLAKYFSFIFLPLLLFPRQKIIKLFFFLALFVIYFKGTHAWYYTWAYMIIPFAQLKKTTLLLLFTHHFLLLIKNYLPFLLFAAWTNYQPLNIIRFLLPITLLTVVFWEFINLQEILNKHTHG